VILLIGTTRAAVLIRSRARRAATTGSTGGGSGGGGGGRVGLSSTPPLHHTLSTCRNMDDPLSTWISLDDPLSTWIIHPLCTGLVPTGSTPIRSHDQYTIDMSVRGCLDSSERRQREVCALWQKPAGDGGHGCGGGGGDHHARSLVRHVHQVARAHSAGGVYTCRPLN